jgi:hypothetical protein
MKKMIFSAAAFGLVAVSSVALAPTTAEAIPAFARQTGAACLACHFQSFPTLNAFGRSFKMNALTDVGDQALIEDDDLSIPSSLNMTLVLRPQFVSTNNAGVKSKAINATADQVILIAGRIGSNTGGFVELGGGTFANNQLFNSWDVAGMKVGASYFNTGFGEDAGLQTMSVWGQHGGLLAGKNISINNIMGAGANTAGVSLWAGNDMAQLQVGMVDPTPTVGTTWKLAPMARLTGFFDVAGMELGLGGIVVSGQTANGVGLARDAKRYGLDVQLQGDLADMPVGLYADYATAKKGTAALANFYNASTTANRTGFSVRGTIKPTHTIVAMAGIGDDKTGTTKVTHTIVGAEYEVYQNFVVALIYQQDKTDTAGTVTKVNTTTLDIEALM